MKARTKASCDRVDLLAFDTVVASVLLKDDRLTLRGIGLLRARDGLPDRLCAVGGTVRMVDGVPFLAQEGGLPEQPVHLLGVLSCPEGEDTVDQVRVTQDGRLKFIFKDKTET